MNPYVNTALKAARKASHIMNKALLKMGDLEIEAKGHNDFVTQVDKAAEASIIDTLQYAYPEHSILGEESGLTEHEGADYLWIIDPLDGTTNFIHGYPNYCISIGLQVQGRLEHALIYNPLNHDVYYASRGKGAYHNDRRVRVSNCKNFDGALASATLPRPKEYFAGQLEMLGIAHQAGTVIRRTGSTALDLAYVATGQIDILWHVDAKPWDLAAGALLVREAGGMVTDMRGSDDFMQNGTVVAANPKLLKLALQTLRPLLPNDSEDNA